MARSLLAGIILSERVATAVASRGIWQSHPVFLSEWVLLQFQAEISSRTVPGNKRLAPGDGAVARYGTCALPGSYRMPYRFHSVKVMGEVVNAVQDLGQQFT